MPPEAVFFRSGGNPPAAMHGTSGGAHIPASAGPQGSGDPSRLSGPGHDPHAGASPPIRDPPAAVFHRDYTGHGSRGIRRVPGPCACACPRHRGVSSKREHNGIGISFPCSGAWPGIADTDAPDMVKMRRHPPCRQGGGVHGFKNGCNCFFHDRPVLFSLWIPGRRTAQAAVCLPSLFCAGRAAGIRKKICLFRCKRV